MQTKFNIGERVYIYDLTKGAVEGVITSIFIKGIPTFVEGRRIPNTVTVIPPRYTIEDSGCQYLDVNEKDVFRTKKELVIEMTRRLNE